MRPIFLIALLVFSAAANAQDPPLLLRNIPRITDTVAPLSTLFINGHRTPDKDVATLSQLAEVRLAGSGAIGHRETFCNCWRLSVADTNYFVAGFAYTHKCRGSDVAPKVFFRDNNLGHHPMCNENGDKLYFDEIVIQHKRKGPTDPAYRFNIGSRTVIIKKDGVR